MGFTFYVEVGRLIGFKGICSQPGAEGEFRSIKEVNDFIHEEYDDNVKVLFDPKKGFKVISRDKSLQTYTWKDDEGNFYVVFGFGDDIEFVNGGPQVIVYYDEDDEDALFSNEEGPYDYVNQVAIKAERDDVVYIIK